MFGSIYFMNKFKLFTSITIICFALVACKSHQKVVVNAEAHFDQEELWILTNMQGKEFSPLNGQKKISIQFNPEAGTFNGHSGCNRYFGQFKDLGNGKMQLGEVDATKMACSEPIHKVESAYLVLLRRCDGYRLDEYRLELMQRDKVLLVYEKVVYER